MDAILLALTAVESKSIESLLSEFDSQLSEMQSQTKAALLSHLTEFHDLPLGNGSRWQYFSLGGLREYHRVKFAPEKDHHPKAD